MRVLLVAHSGGVGGATEVVLSMLRHAPPELDVACVFLAPGPAVDLARPLARTTRVIRAGRARSAWRAPGVVRALRAEIRSAKADVVFAHVTTAHLYAAPAAALERVPYLWWQHERIGQKPLLHALSACLPASAVVCSSEFTAGQQRQPFPHAGQVVCVHPGAEPPRPGEMTAVAPDGNPLLGVVGRLQRWKRVELALRAMPAVLARVPNARLSVIGDATSGLDEDYPEELRVEAARLGISAAVEFRGHVPNAAAQLGRLDVLIHCAELEPFGLVLAEAMLRGVPVIAPDAGGPREIVRHGVDGLLVDPADTNALAAAILALAENSVTRRRMGGSARARAQECFTAERMAAAAWKLATDVAERSER